MNETEMFYPVFVSLAIGLLIGIERGWQQRDSAAGVRSAGIRTYGLIGLLGGITGLLAKQFGGLVLGLVFIALTIMLVSIFIARQEQREDWGMTSLVAALLTFSLAVLAVSGEEVLAVSATVVTLLLLSHKDRLHHWLTKLDDHEIKAGIKLLLISVVMLPILPDQSWDPWQVINLYQIWWMVVIIAVISFFGYFAIKIGGVKHGTLFMAFFGGLASSTAVTLSLSRLQKTQPGNHTLIAAAILIACSTMFVRMLIVIGLLNFALVVHLIIPILLMTVCTVVPALVYWRHGGLVKATSHTLSNPLELKVAIVFGLILVVVMLLSQIFQDQFGDVGLITLAAVSGIADVDAIVLSLLGMASAEKLSVDIFMIGCIVAAGMNSMFKGSLALGIGGRSLGLRVLPPLLISFAVAITYTYYI